MGCSASSSDSHCCCFTVTSDNALCYVADRDKIWLNHGEFTGCCKAPIFIGHAVWIVNTSSNTGEGVAGLCCRTIKRIGQWGCSASSSDSHCCCFTVTSDNALCYVADRDKIWLNHGEFTGCCKAPIFIGHAVWIVNTSSNTGEGVAGLCCRTIKRIGQWGCSASSSDSHCCCFTVTSDNALCYVADRDKIWLNPVNLPGCC